MSFERIRQAELATDTELQELLVTIKGLAPKTNSRRPSVRPVVRLRRTFNQSDFQGGYIKYWRVVEPGHPRNESDLSIEGLREAGIV
jgi:hypothetical protein